MSSKTTTRELAANVRNFVRVYVGILQGATRIDVHTSGERTGVGACACVVSIESHAQTCTPLTSAQEPVHVCACVYVVSVGLHRQACTPLANRRISAVVSTAGPAWRIVSHRS